MDRSVTTGVGLPKPVLISQRFEELSNIWREARGINIVWCDGNEDLDMDMERIACAGNVLDQVRDFGHVLDSAGRTRDAAALQEGYELATMSTDFGGLGMQSDGESPSQQDVSEVLFLVSAHLEALNSAERVKAPTTPLSQRPPGRRAMTLSEKIFAAHDFDRRGEVRPGDVIRVDVDGIIASELSWKVSGATTDRRGT